MPVAIADESERRAAFAAAREMCRRHGGAGYLPSFFLPRSKREGVYAVWAFAQLIQQAAAGENSAGESCSSSCSGAGAGAGSGSGAGSGAGGGGGGVTPLLKSRIDAMYDTPIELPLAQFRDESQWVLVAIADTARRFDVPRKLWHDFIDGLVAQNQVQRVATWRSLDAHVAGTGGNVGRMIAAVLGATHSDAGEFAAAIGRAVGLTSMLRNLKRDLACGRLLLPLEDLARFRYSEREMLAFTVNDTFRSLIRHEVARARELFRQGVAGTCWLDGDGSRMAAAAFVSMQLASLDEIERGPEVVLRDADEQKHRPSLAAQLRTLPRAWRIAKRQAADALPDLQ